MNKRIARNIIFVLMMLCCISMFSGCSGGSSKQEEISTEPLHLETEDGILSYKTQEYVSNGFSTDEGADPSKLICIEFDFTNKSDTPKTVNSVFNINAFQNGVELELNPYSYRTEAAPEAYNNIFKECMNGSTITVGLIYVLNDDSPLTISASPLMSQDEKPVQMLLDVIPYEDNSFDIDRLYGSWTDEKSGKELQLTSETIWLGTNKSSSSFTSEYMWTDEDTLYTGYDNIGDLKIDVNSDPIKMSNENYSFIQNENWSEKESESDGSKQPEKINLGDSIHTDFVEIDFDSEDIRNEIVLEASLVKSEGGNGGNISKRNTIESAQDGTKYLMLQGKIKNTSDAALAVKNMVSKLIVNGNAINAKVTVYDGKASTLHEIEPMNDANIIVTASMSADKVSEIKEGEWQIGFKEKFGFIDSSADISSCKYIYSIPSALSGE